MPSAERLVLDTHVWLDVASGRGRTLSPRTRKRIERAAIGDALYVAAITPWEVAMLARAGRLRVSGSVSEFILEALRDTRTAVAALDPVVAADAVELPAWEHRDPADRMIVATARHLDAVLVTRDDAILEYAVRVKAVEALNPSRR